MLRAVLFDWDGTLSDTAEASFRCYVRLFAELGVPFDRETYARTYSPNWYRTFRDLELPEERWPYADERWLALYAEEQVGIVPGARELLDLLAVRGIRAGIVTSGGAERVSREIERHRLGHRLGVRVFGSDVREKKPHPEGLLLCLKRMDLRPEDVVYVGDSPEDVLMAKAAGVRAIAVPGGFPNVEALRASNPYALVESLLDVAGLIDDPPRAAVPG